MKLDIYDLNYSISSEKINILGYIEKPGKGLIIRVMVFFREMLKSLFYVKKKNFRRITHGTPLFLVFSKNQHDAIYPIISKLKNCIYLGIDNYGEYRFPLTTAYILSIIFFPIVFKHFLNAKGYHKKSFQHFFEHYWLTYGYYLQCRRILKFVKPSIVVVVNDHLMYARALVLAAKQANIKTLYLQHASVSGKFPRLFFDYAFLDGNDSLNKYAVNGYSDTKIFLTGFPKFDRSLKCYNQKSIVENVGICIATLEEESEIEDLCKKLKSESINLNFSIRPHPSDKRIGIWKDLAATYNFSYSNSREESSFDFLQKVDVIISGESNILLEAVLMNVYPIYYDYSSTKIKDMYEFVRNGLVDEPVKTIDALLLILKRIITNRPFIRERAKYYNAVINTKYDGNSLGLVVQLINTISSLEKLPDIWKRFKNTTGLEVYELKS
ncbi:hypothetical protein AC481_06555 [miscellaneous Crenarchaeota group archaeon SMTZ-80]|nr:MAG: hypothetical protein AC481_06555 [miscellaneous Crenarchaeota group archaeon SMTZ-80]